jgi:hypothetical protein
MTWEPCVTCARLTKCGDVDHNLLLEGGGCSLHEPVHEGVIRARLRVIDEYGAIAIPTKKNLKDGVITMAGNLSSTAASKRNLRALGKALNVIPRGGASFKLSAEELCAMIKEGGDPRFATLEKMTDEEVEALTAELGGDEEGGEETPAKKPEPAKPEPAKAPPAKPGPKPAPKQAEPVEEEEEEEPAPKRPVRQPVRASEPTEAPRQADPGVRRPVPRQAPAPAVASASAGSADISELREMLLLIGKTGDARDVVLKKLTAAVENLTEKIEAIDGYLAFRYSEEAGPGNEIKSLTEVSWR